MDSGSIILQESFKISNPSSVNYKSLEESLAEVGGKLAAQVLSDFKTYWKNKKNQLFFIGIKDLSHTRKITKADGIISFKANTFEEISCKVRALSHQIPIRSVDIFDEKNQFLKDQNKTIFPVEQRQVFLEEFDFNIPIPINSHAPVNTNIWYDRSLKAVLFRVVSISCSDCEKFKIIAVRRFKIEGKSQIYSAGSFYSNYLKF